MIDPPYRTDPFQNIVNFGFGGFYLLIQTACLGIKLPQPPTPDFFPPSAYDAFNLRADVSTIIEGAKIAFQAEYTPSETATTFGYIVYAESPYQYMQATFSSSAAASTWITATKIAFNSGDFVQIEDTGLTNNVTVWADGDAGTQSDALAWAIANCNSIVWSVIPPTDYTARQDRQTVTLIKPGQVPAEDLFDVVVSGFGDARCLGGIAAMLFPVAAVDLDATNTASANLAGGNIQPGGVYVPLKWKTSTKQTSDVLNACVWAAVADGNKDGVFANGKWTWSSNRRKHLLSPPTPNTGDVIAEVWPSLSPGIGDIYFVSLYQTSSQNSGVGQLYGTPPEWGDNSATIPTGTAPPLISADIPQDPI